MEKSQFYLSKAAWEMEISVKEVLGFQQGSIPFKYLGVPLISSRLSIKDCEPLMEKLEARLNTWNASSLSYAGRLQLIKNVLCSMQVFWSNIILLPKTITTAIDNRVRRFLWYKKNGVGCSRVQWGKVCRSKKEGGLGLVSAVVQNNTLQVKLLWEVIRANNNSLWIKWLHENRLRHQDIWSIRKSPSHSWGWNRLLSLRETLIPYIIYNSSDRFPLLTITRTCIFNAASIRSLFKPPFTPPYWINMLKPQMAIPKQIFILWLALNDGLFITERFSNMQEQCVLCQDEDGMDTMLHLFFSCSFSHECMIIVSQSLGWEWPTGNWYEATRAAALKWKGSDMNSKLSKLVLASLVYFLWKERNVRKHGGERGNQSSRLGRIMVSNIKERLRAIGEDEEWRIAWDD